MSHEFIFVPVGWGYMSIHAFDGEIVAVTDGGSMPNCFRASEQALRQVINEMPINRCWTWFLSHFDYDHYSLILDLIMQRRWPAPRYVVLPASYSYNVCREAVAMHFALAYLIADMLKLNLPRAEELYERLNDFIKGGTVIYGVAAGDKVVIGGAVYYVIWPEDRYIEENCGELIKVIREKIDKICKGDERCKENAEDIMRRVKSTLGELGVKRVESRILEIHLDKCMNNERRGVSITINEADAPSGQFLSVYETYEVGADRLGDRELLVIHKSVVNMHSLAYVVEGRAWRHIHTDLLSIETPDLHCHHDYLSNGCVLMYLGDLDGNELNKALRNARDADVYYVNVFVAPHHGNAMVPNIDNVPRSRFTYIPRCDEHVNSSWKRNLNMAWLMGTIPVVSNHGNLLRVWVH